TALTVGRLPAIGDAAAQSGLSAGNGVTLHSPGLNIAANIASGGDNTMATSSGPIAVNGLVTLSSSRNIVLSSAGDFIQTGSLLVNGPDLVVGTTGLDASKLVPNTGTNTFTLGNQVGAIGGIMGSFSGGMVSFTALSLPTGTLILSAGTGAITGASVNVNQLGVVIGGGRADLTGSISGNATTTAAELGTAFPMPSNDYRFNTCAIGSVSCLVLPALTPIQPQLITNFEVTVTQPAADDLDAPLTNIFDENRLCDELYRTSPDLAQKVCQ
ncbi:MAG: hypothetical protein JO032_13975, partial [Alphaproteobacteria bacterium]|nr:hypothetical protein [Alphaproteobacteria bacterium]